MERVAQFTDPPQSAAAPGAGPRPSTGYPGFRLPYPDTPSNGGYGPGGAPAGTDETAPVLPPSLGRAA